MDKVKLEKLRELYAEADGSEYLTEKFRRVGDKLKDRPHSATKPYAGIATFLDLDYREDFNGLDVAIIGTGFGGIGAGMRLRAAGERSFLIFEKADKLGGTWRDNHYPGACCDVPGLLYWYSMEFVPTEEQPDWSNVYPTQGELLGLETAPISITDVSPGAIPVVSVSKNKISILLPILIQNVGHRSL